MVDYQEFRRAAANADLESLNEFILNGIGEIKWSGFVEL